MNLRLGLPAATGRLQGYKRALEASGLPFDDSLVMNGDGAARSGYRLAAGLMRASDPPTAMGAYEALKERGLRIPEDVAVVGFDDQDLIAAHLRTALSTVALPHHAMGRWAVEHLIGPRAGRRPDAARHRLPLRRTRVGLSAVGEPGAGQRPGRGGPAW